MLHYGDPRALLGAAADRLAEAPPPGDVTAAAPRAPPCWGSSPRPRRCLHKMPARRRPAFSPQNGVHAGERHGPVAAQQAGGHGRAVGAAQHRVPAHRRGHRQHPSLLPRPLLGREAQAAARDAAPPAPHRGRGEANGGGNAGPPFPGTLDPGPAPFSPTFPLTPSSPPPDLHGHREPRDPHAPLRTDPHSRPETLVPDPHAPLPTDAHSRPETLMPDSQAPLPTDLHRPLAHGPSFPPRDPRARPSRPPGSRTLVPDPHAPCPRTLIRAAGPSFLDPHASPSLPPWSGLSPDRRPHRPRPPGPGGAGGEELEPTGWEGRLGNRRRTWGPPATGIRAAEGGGLRVLSRAPHEQPLVQGACSQILGFFPRTGAPRRSRAWV